MSKTDDLMINRLLVLVQLILIPIYFFFFSIRWRDNLTLFFNNLVESSAFMAQLLPDWLIWFEIHLGIPIFFSFPWVVFSIARATRIADSYELMGRALGRVRIDQKLFYGLNAAFTLIFLIFPFLSPLITVIGIFWGVRIVLRKLKIGKISWIFWFIPALILSFVPGLIAFAFYSNYLILFDEIFTFWRSAIPTLFGIGLSLAIAIAIGNFLLFLFEGRKLYGTGEDVPYGFVLVFKTFLFILLLIIFLASTANDPTLAIPRFINYVNYFAAAVGGFELVARKMRDMPGEGGSEGVIMVLAFSFVNIIITFIRDYTALTQWIQAIVILVSGFMFLILFYLSYSYAPEEYDYPEDDEEPKSQQSTEPNETKEE